MALYNQKRIEEEIQRREIIVYGLTENISEITKSIKSILKKDVTRDDVNLMKLGKLAERRVFLNKLIDKYNQEMDTFRIELDKMLQDKLLNSGEGVVAIDVFEDIF